jgi:hypothetical protein
VFAGLWSGLLGTLTTILHPMLAAMDGRDFRNFMGAFLRFARKAWFNYVCAIGMAIAPIAALVALWGEWASASFVLTAIGLAIVIAGVYVVSNVWKEPHYDVMLAWNPEGMLSSGGVPATCWVRWSRLAPRSLSHRLSSASTSLPRTVGVG